MRYLLPTFIVLPILEMYVLIKVGGNLGALNTVLLVLLTAVIRFLPIEKSSRELGHLLIAKVESYRMAQLPAADNVLNDSVHLQCGEVLCW